MAQMDQEDEFYPPIDVRLEESIRESVAHWKTINKQQLKNGEAVEMALKEPPTQARRREFSG